MSIAPPGPVGGLCFFRVPPCPDPLKLALTPSSPQLMVHQQLNGWRTDLSFGAVASRTCRYNPVSFWRSPDVENNRFPGRVKHDNDIHQLAARTLPDNALGKAIRSSLT